MKRINTRGKAKPEAAHSAERRKLQALKVPKDAQIKAVVGGFRLAKGQAAVLDFIVKDTLADLRSYQGWRVHKIDHDERVAEPIDEIYQSLSRLVSSLEAYPNALKDILSAPTGAKLGDLFSFTGIGKALDRDAFPDDGKSLRSHFRRNAQQFDIAAAEKFYARPREDYGLLYGDRLLLYALRVVLEPLEGGFAAKAANKGGRPPNIERRYLIERLTKAAPKILGSEPPISVGSRFVELCERVLPLCGFSKDGIDKAVVSVLSAMGSKARPLSRLEE
jgi:hypothetical protein